ncbi:putative hydrophobic protein (TIGR00341 family) [Ochrobactrum daejeonense]|uniref:Putative hydrophobic protein (TIGR00341 family) n=1 Tax=Brucella daejeonensis TaxID=659015 RepID=A0A7W9EL67_9HYPH|nr:TIGR00341 family protein [Brucella daejeonensis]MBB5700740.1 putative hydrophobic protein (TIGR00341 family) [Brucella daejeonensis]
MSLRRIEVVADERYADRIQAIAREFDALDYRAWPLAEDGRHLYQLLIGRGKRQELLDTLQTILGGDADARIVVMEVEATIPSEETESEEEAAERWRKTLNATREEIYNQVQHGADLDRTYLLQTVLSTVVAAIGLIENNVAVVIGAMVIAPLLGPNLAFAFGVALGDGRLMLRALKTGLAGITTAVVLGSAIGMTGAFPLDGPELLARTGVGLDGIALALASGAAAALSITTGLPTALVGVMVAVALLPPTATAGLMFGAYHFVEASGALLLLVVNIASVNLAAVVVFQTSGIKPRTWLEQRAARQSVLVSVVVWSLLLAILASIIVFRQPY